jgi:hypothetical protein
MRDFRLTWLPSDLFRECNIPNDVQYRFGYSHLAYLTVPVHQVACSTSPCGRLSRPPWWIANSHDYYWNSVTIGLASLRQSRVPSLRNVLERLRLPTHVLE